MVEPSKSERAGGSCVEFVLVLRSWWGASPYLLSVTVIVIVVAVFLLSDSTVQAGGAHSSQPRHVIARVPVRLDMRRSVAAPSSTRQQVTRERASE